jgi:hypothetical protein
MDDRSRLARLRDIKLATLVREHLGGAPSLAPGELGGGAALLHGTDAWVLLAQAPGRGLGGALAWALRQGAGHLHVVADDGTGMLARRAAGFSLPVTVWHAVGRALRPAAPEPFPEPVEVPAAHRLLAEAIVEAGAEPCVEHGVLSGEVLGLEVCRVVDDPYTGEVRLEVGVGAHDRDAFRTLHGDRPSADALADVVRTVVARRSPGASGHPLNRLAKERLLRSRLVAHPELVGASSITVAAPPLPRPNLKDPVPCVARAVIGGVGVTVVCSAGVDLDAVPYAVDARFAAGTERCLLVLPARDAVPLQHLLASVADPPVELVALDDE